MTSVKVEAAPIVRAPASPVRMILVLGMISTICGIVIVVAYSVTIPAIRANLAQIARDAVLEVLPAAKEVKIFQVRETGEIQEVQSLVGEAMRFFVGYDEKGDFVGVAIQARGRGYGDLISIMYGYDPARESIIGFKVLESKETPGLGDKIATDEEFLKNFQELDVALNSEGTGLAHPIEAVKHGFKKERWQIDGISGATISSQAVGRIISESASKYLPIIRKNIDLLKKRAVS